jgi:hypothetical protein
MPGDGGSGASSDANAHQTRVFLGGARLGCAPNKRDSFDFAHDK